MNHGIDKDNRFLVLHKINLVAFLCRGVANKHPFLCSGSKIGFNVRVILNEGLKTKKERKEVASRVETMRGTPLPKGEERSQMTR